MGAIVWDLVATMVGFLAVIAAVALAVQGLSVG
jgi:hypothetical protein